MSSLLTRFLFTTKTKIGSDMVRLKHKSPWLAEGDAKKITVMVARARQMLSSTIAALNCGTVKSEFARTYFTAVPTAGEWQRIQAKLELIYGGLNTDVTLKLGADSSEAPGRVGFVKQTGRWVGPGEIEWSYEGRTIHVSKKYMLRNEEGGVRTIIHEASHKYANTEDHDWRGYREADDSRWMDPGLTKAEALNNADSYAWFVYQQGASMGA
jgi:hypothetical protein